MPGRCVISPLATTTYLCSEETSQAAWNIYKQRDTPGKHSRSFKSLVIYFSGKLYFIQDFVGKNEKSIKQISSERGNSVVVVKLMDGHFDDETWWPRSSVEEQFHHYQLLQLFGGKEAASLQPCTSGRAWQDFILDSLPEKIRKKREIIIFCLYLERSQVSRPHPEKISEGTEHRHSTLCEWSNSGH